MEESIINNIEEQNTQPIQAEEKMFTQAEVNEIVRKRLAREKEKVSSEMPALTDADLTARSNRLDCKEYLLNKGLSMDLLDVIDTSDSAAFIEKVEKVSGIVEEVSRNSYPVVPDGGEPIVSPTDNVKAAFFDKTGHKPKKPKNYYY